MAPFADPNTDAPEVLKAALDQPDAMFSANAYLGQLLVKNKAAVGAQDYNQG
jgi:hypothetical protein